MDHKIHIAPMMGYTHRHFRYLMRKICPGALLYSEMVTTGALLHGDVSRSLLFDKSELPVVLQLGGNDPNALAKCAKMGERFGYSQINLNVGCPSSRVKDGGIGACLYKTPERVADCVSAMKKAVDLPVTVKCRIGVDEHDSFDQLVHFCQSVSDAGSSFVIVHARKAWLNGLNPKQNRTIPPLRYDVAAQLADVVDCPIVLNGGIESLDAVSLHLQTFPAVMIGRWACKDPMGVGRFFTDGTDVSSCLSDILSDYFAYVERSLVTGESISFLLQPLQGLFHASAGAKQWRKGINEVAQHFRKTNRIPKDLYQDMLHRALCC